MNPSDRWEYDSVPFKLTDPHCAIVEQIRPSGMTESGLYVLDQESKFAAETSMLYRVVGKADGCQLKLGAVYLCPVYASETLVHNGVKYEIMHEANCRAEVEGYDG